MSGPDTDGVSLEAVIKETLAKDALSPALFIELSLPQKNSPMNHTSQNLGKPSATSKVMAGFTNLTHAVVMPNSGVGWILITSGGST